MTSMQLNLGLGPGHRNHYLFSDHYLEAILPKDPRWGAALPEAKALLIWLRELYQQEAANLQYYNESQLEEHWFWPILARLGHIYERQAGIPGLEKGIKHPDYVFFPDDLARQAALRAQKSSEYATQALAVGEVKAWEVSLGKKASSGAGDFKDQNPSFQIDYYLRASGLNWGILSNGRCWRLVHKESSQRLSTFYEIDLIDLIGRGDPAALGYFLLFFRQAAFRPDEQGNVFLEDALGESRAYAVALEEDLKGNAYRALELLIHGFLDLPENPLALDDLPTIYTNSLYLLYRLLFILYAESRGLLPLDNEQYREHYSLQDIKKDIANRNAPGARRTTIFWGRLKQLFHIIDGEDVETNRFLGVPRYNGGLFSPGLHPFLEERSVGDRALVEAIDLLCRRQTPAGLEFVDYRTLGIRHLGSIYEGLLEYRAIPVEASEIAEGSASFALVTDRGERKATGSYYTPQYIVEYIVKNTLGPLVESAVERVKARGQAAKGKAAQRAAAQSLVDEILNLKVLDPAMGSGHFLVEATEFLALGLATDPFVQSGEAQEEDLIYWRRRVVERCIYGVDKNPLAVELAKLSLWLETVARERPLSFLDHHLKCGDSLVGAKTAELGWAPPTILGKKALKDLEQQKAGQINMYQYLLSQQLPAVLGRVLEITEKESDSYETVQAKEAANRAIAGLKAPFEAVADLWTSAYFGNKFTQKDYGEALDLIHQPEALLELQAVTQAREMAKERRFFHWELAFPEVFYDRNGQGLRETAGFDAVIGNPPFVSNWELTKQDSMLPEILASFYPDEASGHWDIYVLFISNALKLMNKSGMHSFIVPSAMAKERYGLNLRKTIIEKFSLVSIVDFGEHLIFEDVARQYIIYVISPDRKNSRTGIYRYVENDIHLAGEIEQSAFGSFSYYSFRTDLGQNEILIKQKMEGLSILLGTICCVNPGVVAHSRVDSPIKFRKEDVISAIKVNAGYKMYIEGDDIGRWTLSWQGLYIDYEGRRDLFHRPKFPELFESEKIMIRGVSGENNSIVSTYDTEGYYSNHSIFHLVLWTPRIIELQHSSGFTIDMDLIKYDLHFIAALINSSLINFLFSRFLATGTLQGSYSGVYPEDARKFPIRKILFTTLAEDKSMLLEQGEELFDKFLRSGNCEPLLAFISRCLTHDPEQSDVVHDLLTLLAEQMIAMNKEKHLLAERFWTDVEGVSEARAFQKLHDKGKQESSLWREAACRPYVREGSGSRRTLDESLAWDEAAFKAFVRALARDNAPGLSRLVQVYRAHSPAYVDLTRRLALTDRLIDRVVYQLYGLTDEEIAVVEGRTS